MKDELIQQLRLLGMGRVNAAYAIADALDGMVAQAVEVYRDKLIADMKGTPYTMQAYVDLDKVHGDCSEAAEALKAETVEIEVEAPPPDPAPAKPKRKKA